ncbi:MAG: tetratricopeptide repeat protein [Maricaulaceae bacterium]|jgi:tetratricopeptide (TPR) repeat protein
MSPVDFDALLAADAEGAKREVKDAQPIHALTGLTSSNITDGKLLTLLRRALKAADEGDLPGAGRIALRALDLNSDHPMCNQVMGLVLERMNRLSQALDFYERALNRDPSNPEVYYNIGLIGWKLDMLDHAEKFFRMSLERAPSAPDSIINLAGVLRDKGLYEDSIEILRMATYADPENPLFWNSIGTSVLEMGDPEQSKTFYQETLRLSPDFARAWHNLGYAQTLVGEVEESARSSNKALENPKSATDRAEMLYSRGMSYLACGELERGWEDYEIRLSTDYKHATLYITGAPRWDGISPLKGKHLALFGEQGVGDEVLFLNVAPDVIEDLGPEGRLTIACERRLMPLVARSFPEARVVPHATKKTQGRAFRGAPEIQEWSEIDLWCAMATPNRRFRRKVEDFPRGEGHFKPDPERVAEMKAALAKLPAGPKIGLCWKSKLMTAKRTKYFSAFGEWERVLKTPGAVFVCLQYGDVEEEIAQAAKDFGVTIHQIPDLDLMDDLDGVAALGAALDLSMGPLNASTNLAGAVGGEVWFVALSSNWPLHGTDRVPSYPRSRAFWPTVYGQWDVPLQAVAGELQEFVAGRKAA